jgi:polysaccharide export outer membrane protein
LRCGTAQWLTRGRDYAYVTGEFSTQTRVPLPFNKTASLADIIYEVGGVKPITGNSGQVYVLRATEKNDAVTAFHLDMANVGNIPLATKFVVKPNDVIFAEEQPITKWSRALEQFFPTLIGAATSASN